MSTYAKQYYGVPADIGRRVLVNGKPGIIAADGGQYISVNFDAHKPGQRLPCHPTWKVEYLEMGEIRKPTRSQQRYLRFLSWKDAFGGTFRQFLKYEATP